MQRSMLFILTIIMAITIHSTSVSAASRSITVSIDPQSIQANMGDKITFAGTITNNSDRAVNGIIAYISLANITQGKESPMDLEDWSANRAVKVETIAPHATYEGKWPMRLIDSGSYVAYITAVDKNSSSPVSSTMSHLEIRRILRLNPNNVLPVAVGEPILIGMVLMFISFKRRNRVK